MKNRGLLISISVALVILVGVITLLNRGGESSLDSEEIIAVQDKHADETTGLDEESIEYGTTKGFLWEVKEGDSIVYLFGSLDISNSSLGPFELIVEKAFKNSDFLVVEYDSTNPDFHNVNFDEFLYYGAEDNVFNHLSDEGFRKINEVCKELSMDPDNFSKLKIWVIGSTLNSYRYQVLGYNSLYGASMYFTTKAIESNKEILELGGVEQFYRTHEILSNLPAAEQEQYYILTIRTMEEAKRMLGNIVTAYKSGDDGILELMTTGSQETKRVDHESEYYKYQVDSRENALANIEQLLLTDKTYFLVMNLSQLMGENEIIDTLRGRGHTVNRIN